MQKQTESILRHLQIHGSIEPLTALQQYGCFRLASRIWDLRSAGHDIHTENVTSGGKTYAKYTLARKPEQMEAFV
jgi:hypothetical protein